MKMLKKILLGVLCLMLISGTFVSCKNETGETPPATDNTPQAPEQQKKDDGVIKILAIGNSFSVDTMEYLYDVAKSAGKRVLLGNMYIGGCSVATHLQHAKANDGAYTYYKNVAGAWETEKNVKFADAVKDEKWDYITIQQTSKTCGIASSYGQNLKDLVDIVLDLRVNENAKLLWHMTWAYQQDSTHASFPNYDRDQMKMYTMTVDAVKTQVLTNEKFDGVIATGTAIQNARTSFAGDHLTRDGYHLNYTLGRYIGALSWYATITGGSLDEVTFIPAADITPEVAAMAKDAVKASIATPYAVTQSTHTSGTWSSDPAANSTQVVNPEDCFETDRALAAAKGIDLDRYELLVYDYLTNQYWYCTNGAETTVPPSSNSTYQQNICSAKIYTKAEIGEGAVIVCDAGWQYRPELWKTLDAKAASRPDMERVGVKILDAKFWSDNNYFAFNIAKDPKTNISAYYSAAASHVRIYIPKA